MTTTESTPTGPNPEGQDQYTTETTFASLGVCAPLVEALDRQGIVKAFPIQALTVRDALAGRDVCGKAKTGSGKTLGFGVPLIQRTWESLGGAKGELRQIEGGPARPRALVLLPTRELCVQVAEVLSPLAEDLGMRCVAVYGGADIERQIKQLRKGCEVIIATPGRL
ncbi:MAG: DEAD/DEAH box helicase, partial [Actinomycetota bacterium]